MKVYSIGREVGCDIVINDTTNVVSRRHAILNVASSGKMTIVDQSQNGTYVNGIRVSPNVPVPVTRKDNVSFAHIARLDWNLIPNPRARIMQYALLVAAAIALVIGVVLGIYGFNVKSTPDSDVVAVDSNAIRQNEKKLKEREQQKQDSIRKHVEDSIKAIRIKQTPEKKEVKHDSKRQEAKPAKPTAKKDVKNKETKNKESDKQPRRLR